ncbi:MAG TPA: helix-turn-helix domain-containing protein [Ktedonobacteraceae bacterium]
MEEHGILAREAVPECRADSLSMREAASMLGVSQRSVYGYIESGKLAGERSNKIIRVSAQEVATFERRAPGRVRSAPPRWRWPPEQNPLYLTTILVRVRPDGAALLDATCAEFRVQNKHRLPGTSARYIGRNLDDPDEVNIVLVWRRASMPPDEQRAGSRGPLRRFS